MGKLLTEDEREKCADDNVGLSRLMSILLTMSNVATNDALGQGHTQTTAGESTPKGGHAH